MLIFLGDKQGPRAGGPKCELSDCDERATGPQRCLTNYFGMSTDTFVISRTVAY